MKKPNKESTFKTMFVLLIDDSGNKLNITLDEAKRMAFNRGLDLITINREKQVYKLGNLEKLNYEKKIRDKKLKAQQRGHKVKEIHIRPTTDVGDLEVKTRKVKDLLGDGFKTKLVMKFKKSELGYKDVGMQKFKDLVQKITNDGSAAIEGNPKFDGNNIFAFLLPSLEKNRDNK